jgi:superfamily I DNA/RNA helicase
MRIGIRLYESRFRKPNLASRADIVEVLRKAAEETPDHRFHRRFLLTEWEQVVDAWQIKSADGYANVSRLGRKTKVPKKQQAILWSIFQRVTDGLKDRELITTSELFTKLAAAIEKEKSPPFDFAVVDEAQDLTVAHLRLFAALGHNRPNSLFFAGDLGQRIFQQPFSWLELGIDVRGRSQNLNVNYRTSHQIRTQSDRLLGAEISDLDGNLQKRSGTVSVFNGPPPTSEILKTENEEIECVSKWIGDRTKEGVVPHEFAVFVRSAAQLPRARAAVEKSGIPLKILDENVNVTSNYASISTMHLAKGLEFRAVVVMACDDEVIPLQERIEEVGDDADLQEVYDTERHLLYVACTRARDYLLITAVDPASEFLDDLKG